MTNAQCADKVIDGYKLSKPSSCTDKIYDNIMLKCWAFEPSDRPTFEQILEIWKEIQGDQRRSVLLQNNLQDSENVYKITETNQRNNYNVNENNYNA